MEVESGKGFYRILLTTSHLLTLTMLIELSIKDFAIIDTLTIGFGKGLNVFTGETGAGKSIIIDAIALILGDRARTTL